MRGGGSAYNALVMEVLLSVAAHAGDRAAVYSGRAAVVMGTCTWQLAFALLPCAARHLRRGSVAAVHAPIRRCPGARRAGSLVAKAPSAVRAGPRYPHPTSRLGRTARRVVVVRGA